ncbi:hypothetical protein F7R02_25935, partial [Xanthomonas cissicola]|uniref:hypothetical protein n=1 Tax=Xanthomonas cissicola TaxID=86186 RepID=UPI001246C87C
PVNQEIPTESARNGEIPKIQTPLFGTTRHPALSGLVIQTFPSLQAIAARRYRRAQLVGFAHKQMWVLPPDYL